MLFAFRSIKTCLELRTGRRFWGARGKILGPQTTSEQNVNKQGPPNEGLGPEAHLAFTGFREIRPCVYAGTVQK
jgi:hypothetical protein